MREIIARIVCLGTVAMVVVLAAAFALRHNDRPVRGKPAATETVEPRATSTPFARGRQVFAEASCGTCHSFSNTGNPRRPLDGIGKRRQPEELQDWITGSGAAAGQLSPSVSRRKRRYRELPEEDMTALIAYLLGAGSS